MPQSGKSVAGVLFLICALLCLCSSFCAGLKASGLIPFGSTTDPSTDPTLTTTTTTTTTPSTAVTTTPTTTATTAATTTTPTTVTTTTPVPTTPAPTIAPVSTPVISPVSISVAYSTFQNVDQQGGDIWSGTAVNLEDCNSKCTAVQDCKSTQFKTATKECWLKNSVNPKAFLAIPASLGGNLSFKNAPVVKGTQAVNVDRPNADVTGNYTVGDEIQCQQLGMLSPGVVATVYAPNEKLCWLKSAITPAVGVANRNTFTFTR